MRSSIFKDKTLLITGGTGSFETVEDGWNVVIGANGEGTEDTDHQHLYRGRIIHAARSFKPNKEQQNIFGDGKATEMICELLVG